MEQQQVFQLIQESTDSLYNSGLIPEKVTVFNDTVLLGKGSILDSVAFITLFSEIEDRLSEKTGKEIFIDFAQLHDFNSDKSMLNVSTLADYIIKLLNP